MRPLITCCFVAVALALKPVQRRDVVVHRRDVCAAPLAAAAALLRAPHASAAAPGFAAEAARIPVFVITTPDGTTPLFTDSSAKGGPLDLAFFFAQRADAEKKLKKLKLKADEGAVMALPLAEALALRKQPAADLGGTFQLSSNKGEADDASAIANVAIQADDIPLFFDPRLAQKEPAALFLFFKKADLDAAWLKAAGGKLRDVGYPNYRVTSVRALADRADGPPFLLSTSETFN